MATTRKKKTESFPFPFFGHTVPEPGTGVHLWAVHFVEEPSRAVRAKVARILVSALGRGMFLQTEEASWKWSKEWLVVSADEHDAAPDLATEERFAAFAEVEKAFIAVHAIAPILELLADGYETPSATEWDAWSRAEGRKPSVKGHAVFRRGRADQAVETLRLADPGVASGAAGGLSIAEVDKKLVPSSKLLPPAAARLDEIQAQESRSDRIYSVTDTPAGQAVWFMSSVDRVAASELGLATTSSYAGMPAHAQWSSNYERGAVDGDAEGWLLITHNRREAVIEMHPQTATSRFVCDVPFGGDGAIEAVRVGPRIVVSTTYGLFLVERSERHAAVPVAFLPRHRYRHVAPVPARDGVVSCEFSGGSGVVALVSVGRRLEIANEIGASPAVTQPVLQEGRVLARQGRSWREIRGVEVPTRAEIDERAVLAADAEARLARGQAALVPVDDGELLAAALPLRFHEGRRVIAACRARDAEVLILDEVEHHAIVVIPDAGAARRVAVPERSFASTVDPSPDGRRVLVAGRSFLHAELFVEEAELRPIGDPMRRATPNRGTNVACYVADDRILFPYGGELRVTNVQGDIVQTVATELHHRPNLAAASAARNVLFRTSAGEAVFVRTREGTVVSHEVVGSHVAHVFAHGQELYAMCNSVACRVVAAV